MKKPDTVREALDRIQVLLMEEVRSGGEPLHTMIRARAAETRDAFDDYPVGTAPSKALITLALIYRYLMMITRLQNEQQLDTAAFMASIATVENFEPRTEGWSL